MSTELVYKADEQSMSHENSIEESVMTAILAGRLPPGTRLGEANLARAFHASRTRVREALMKLEVRGVVYVASRRGWYVAEPSAEDAHAAFHARKAIETGMLNGLDRIPPDRLERLRKHVEAEQRDIASGDVAARTCALGDFHILLAEATGNPLLVDILRDLTARTILVSMLYQSDSAAAASNEDHAVIFDALAAGDFQRAADLMADHIDAVEHGLDLSVRPDPVDALQALFSLDDPSGSQDRHPAHSKPAKELQHES